MIKGKKIFITGGAGFLGKHVIGRFYENNDIVCYSRDEAKHYLLKKKYPNIKCVVGDVRDANRLTRAAQGCHVGIFTASLKQISACDENPMEAVQTIIVGAINSRQAAEDNDFVSSCFISTDKACSATTIYGASKYVAEQSFIVNSSNVRLSACRYGNVTNSTGSIIPLIKDALANKYELELFSEEMTRFMFSVNEAVNLIERSLLNYDKAVVVPKINSYKVKDLFDIYKEEFGLRFKTSYPRVGEKIHESMISPEESHRVWWNGVDYLVYPSTSWGKSHFKNNEYSSRDYVISKEELKAHLVENKYYM